MPLPTPDSTTSQEPGRLEARRIETELGLLSVLADALDLPTRWMHDTKGVSKDFRAQVLILLSDFPTLVDHRWKTSMMDICTAVANGGFPLEEGLTAMAGELSPEALETLVDLPAGPAGAGDPVKVALPPQDPTTPSIKVHQPTAIYLKFLDLLARTMEASPQSAFDAHDSAAKLRLLRAAMVSGLSGSPLEIDLDRMRQDLARRDPDPGIQGRVRAIKTFHSALAELASQRVIGPILLVSSDPARRTESGWTARGDQWTSSSDAPLRALLPGLAPLPTQRTAEEVLSRTFARWNFPADRWKLSRIQGRLQIHSNIPNGVGTTIEFPAATAETVVAQNGHLLTLIRLLRQTGLGAQDPSVWPETLSLDQNEFKAGRQVLASADQQGRWTVDQVAVHRLFSVVLAPEASAGTQPAGAWSDQTPLPPFEMLAEPSTDPGDLPLFIALENDKAMDLAGMTLSYKYVKRGGMVWIRLAADGSWTFRQGEALLKPDPDFAPRRPIQLIVAGHGALDPRTKQSLMAGYTPRVLAGHIGRLLKQLKDSYPEAMGDVARTRLFGCILASPVLDGSFGDEFATSAEAQGWAGPGMRTTVYADILSHEGVGAQARVGTRSYADQALTRHKPGVTLQYWVEDGQVRHADKYPGDGTGDALTGDIGPIVNFMGETGGTGASSGTTAAAADTRLQALEERAATTARDLQTKLVGKFPRVATTMETRRRLSVALGQVAQRIYGPGLQVRQAVSGASAQHLDAASARLLDEAAAHVLTGMFDGSFAPLAEAHRSLLTAFVSSGSEPSRATEQALEALTTLKDNLHSLMVGLVDDTTCQASKSLAESYIHSLRQPPATTATTTITADQTGGAPPVHTTSLSPSPMATTSGDVGRGAVIAHTLDQLTGSWPDDATLSSPLRSDLRQALDRLPLSDIEAPLTSAALRQLTAQLFDAILDERPLQMGQVYAALVEAERQDQGDAGAGARATRSFQGLVDDVGGLLVGHADATAETRTVRGRALAAFFGEALESNGPDRPFAVRLDPMLQARGSAADRALRIDAGLRLAALERLRLLSVTGVIGPLSFVAASLPLDADDEGVHWRGLADGSYETSPAGAARLLAGLFFDPVNERVARLRDDVLIGALSGHWKRFVASVPAGTGQQPGSPEAQAGARLAGFGQAIVDDLAGLAARPSPERGIVMGAVSWQRRRSEMSTLLAALRADPAATPAILDAGVRLERVMNHFVDQLISGWVRQSALGWHALGPVTETLPLPLLSSLAPRMAQRLDRAAGIVELAMDARDKRRWRVPALGDPADPAMWARQDAALRHMDIWMARDHVSADGQSLDALPSQVRLVDGLLEIDGVVTARLGRVDDDDAVGPTPPSDAWRPNWDSSKSTSESDTISVSDPDSDTDTVSFRDSDSDSDSGTVSARGSDSDPDTPSTVGPETPPARSRWSSDPAGALTIEQRASTIAATFEVDTAGWGPSPADVDALRERLLPGLRGAAAAHGKALPATSLAAGAAPMLDALISGSPLRMRDAYLALLDAVDPARLRTPALLAQASSQFSALKRLAWAGVASTTGEYRAATSQALADLYLAAVDAASGTTLKLSLDEINFTPRDNRSRSRDAAAGVTLTLYERLRQLNRAGLIGEVTWASSTPHADAKWLPSGAGFVSTDDMRDLRARWIFDPAAGLQERAQPALPLPASIDDARPLCTLAALSPGLRQTLDRRAGTVRLAWTSAEVRGYALLVLPPESTGSGMTGRGMSDLDGRLRQLDLLVSAHVARADGADLDALPARLSFTATELSDKRQVIARGTSSGWRFGLDTPAVPRGARPMPVDGTGRVEVVTSLLQAATTSWHAPAGWTDAEKDTLVDAFGVRRFEEFAVGDSRTLSMRPVSETLLAGILDHSVRTLRRAYDLMLRAVRPDQDLAPLHRQAAMVFRLLVDRASNFLADQPGDGQAMVRSLPGRTLAGFYADLLTSAAEGTPLTLDFESMRTALDRGYVNDPAATRYGGLVLAMRDQLRLMAATGVIGAVRHAAARVPNDDSGEGWAFDGQRWTTQRDMMAEYWPTAAFDPVSGKVGRQARKDLVKPWEDFADELSSRTWPDMASRIAANRLDDWADAIADELRSLARKPVADRSAGMDAAAWRRRRAQAQALRDGIHLEDRIDEAVRDYADRLVAIAQAAAEEAATPARQAAFGRGTMPAVDDAVPLPLLQRIAPGVSQQLDRDAGVVRLSQDGTAAVWRLPAASGGDAAAHWRLDEALRTVDALVTRDFARGRPSTLETLPRHLTYAGGELRAGSGELLARRLDLSPSDPRPVPEGILDGDSGAMADVSADGSSSGAVSATSLLDRPLARWRNELTARKRGSGAWQALKDQVTTSGRAGKQPRMMMRRVILQMDDSPQAFEASLRHAGRASARGGVLWLQADRRGRERVVAGGELIGTTWAGDRLKLVVVGQGGQQGNGQRLSGYDGSALATRVEQVLSRQLGSGRPVFGKVTLLACDLEADLPQSRFVPDFVAGFQPALAYDVTAFKGQVLFPVDDPQADGLTQRWTLGEGAIRAMRHAADGAFVTRHVPGAPPQPATPKHAHDLPIVLPTAETLGALDTALDDGVAQAQRLLATIEESLAIYDPALDGRPPEVLRALFTHGDGQVDGQVDEMRLQRVASDPLEQDRLLQDLRRRLATAEPGQVDARSLSRWTGESLAGLVVSMRGHDMSAAFLDSLGARVKQGQSPDMRLPQMLGQERPRDGILQAHRGLTLDAESFQRVLRQLPDEAGSWVRLAAVTAWMSDQGDPAPLFHGQGRAGAMAMAERLVRTVFDARNIDSAAIVDLHAAILGGEVGSPGGAGTVPGVRDGRAAAPEYGLLDVLHRALTPPVTEGGPTPWTPERAGAWNAKREQLFRLLAADWPVVEQPAMRLALTAAGEALLSGGSSPDLSALRTAFLSDGQGDAIAALPDGPFGDIDRLRIDATTRSAHVPSRSIRRSTRLYLDFLDGMAALIEANPEIASAPWRKAATLRWMRAAMASGLGDAPFLIDIDRIQRDLTSSTPAASGRIEALKQGYPTLAELSRQGAIGQIRFISGDTARRAGPSWTPTGPQWSWSRVDQMPRLIPDLPRPPAAPAPEDTLRAIFGKRRYLVSREQGTLWVPHDGPHGRRTLIHFAPPSEGSPDRLVAQDASLRTLARLLPLSGLTAETIDRWPDTMWLDPREFRAGAHVLARAAGDGRWTIHRGTVGRLLATFDHPQLSATTGGFTSGTNGTNGAGGADPAVRMEDVLIDRRNLTAWQAALDSDGSARDGHDGRSPAAARDPVPERGLIAYLHETLTRPLPGDAGDAGSRAADAGWRHSATGHRLMNDALLLRWPQLRNIRMLRIVDQQRDAILDGRFPNVYEAFLDALTGENPRLPLTEGAPGPSRTISASTALYLDFLEEMIRFVDDNRPPTMDLRRQSPLLRLMREALTSGLKRTPFLIDLDRFQTSPRHRLPDEEAHINVLKQSYPALTELARQGVIGEIRFISSDPAHRADPRWTPIDEQRSWSGDDPLQRLFTDPAPLPPAQSAEEALAAVGIDGRSRLDRAAGTLRVATGTPGEPDTVIRFSPLPADASPDLRAGQDRQLLTLARLLRLSGLADTPVRHWPTALSIGQDEFKAGSLLVARADGTGRWTVDDAAQRRLLRIVARARDAAWSTLRPVSAWRDHRPADDGSDHSDRDLPPKLDPRAVRDPDVLRIYVALQDDRVIDLMGDTLSRKYKRGVVLVRLAEDGSWTVRHGRELLDDALLGKRPVRLILGGHGQVDPATKATLLATYTPERIATSIGRLLAAMRPGVTTKVEGTRILSCALETPTASGSFGRAFAQAADTAGWAAPGMRTTVYSDLLVHQLSPVSGAGGDDDHFFTRLDQTGQDVRQAAGVTWQFWMENGEVHGQDKYPGGGEGRLIETAGPRSLVGDTEDAAARSRQLTGPQRADQARRVRLVLEVLAQLAPDEPPPSFAMHRSDVLTLSDQVLSVLMARYGLPDDDFERLALLQDIADDISQGLLGDATPLLRAYERIGHLTRGAEDVEVSRGWLARANGSRHAQEVLDRIAGSPARIGRSTDLFLKVLAAARDSLSLENPKLRSTPSRVLGRITLLTGAVGAAASDGALYVDMSPVDVLSGLAGGRDIELFRARTALLHLRDLGALRDVVALSIDTPAAAPRAAAEGWRALGTLEVRPAAAGSAAAVVAVEVAPLSEPLFAAGFRHLEKFDDHGTPAWTHQSTSTLSMMTRGLSDPLTKALVRLRTLQHNDLTPEGRTALGTLIDDLDRRLQRIRRDSAPAWTFDTFQQELLATGADRLPHRDAIDPDSLAPHFKDLSLAESERLSDAMGIHRDAVHALDAQVQAYRKFMAARMPGNSAEAADLLPGQQPLAALLDRAPHVRQSLDRVTGEIRLEHPRTRIITTLSVDPLEAYRSDGATERTAMVRQDADIRTAEALVVRFLQASSALPADRPQALGELPRGMSLRNGEFRVNAQVVARRRDGPLSGRDAFGTAAWTVDRDGVASVLRTLRGAGGPTAFPSELTPWENSLGILPPPATPRRPLAKLKLIVQVDGDAHSRVAAQLLMKKHVDRAVWLQMSRPQRFPDRARVRRIAGDGVLSDITSRTEVDILVVGHSGMQLGESQSLSGWSPHELADALRNDVLGHLPDVRPMLRRVSLVACDLQAPSVGSPFAVDFIKALVEPGWTSRADMTARTGHVHVAELIDPVDGGRRIMKLTERRDGSGTRLLRHRMPADTKRLTLDGATGQVTIVDRYVDPDDASSRSWARPAEDLLLMFDSVLGGTVPTPLIELFTGADGQVDEDRMRRVARDPVEGRQLADDLARSIEALPQHARDQVTAHALVDASLAGRVVTLQGRTLSAQFLHALGARIDGEPLTAARLVAAAADPASDFAGRLTLDPMLFEQVLPLLPADRDVAVRLDGLAAWLRGRASTDRPSSPFHGTASAQATALAARLAAVPVDAHGHAAGEDTLLAAVRRAPDAADSGTLMRDILDQLSPQARAFFDGIDIDAIGPIPDASLASHAAPGTPLERVMASIARDVLPGSEDPWGLSRISEDNALTGLRSAGLVEVDAQGVPRLQADKLTQLIADGDDTRLMRAAGGLLRLPDAVFDRVAASPPGKVAGRIVARLREVRISLRAAMRGVDTSSAANLGLGLANTVIGAWQLAQGWRSMDATMKGLSIVQTASIVITPLTAKLGAWLASLGVVGRNAVLGFFSRGLAAGGIDLPLTVLGLIVIGLQWQAFRKSGLGTDSYAYRSLMASTVIISASAAAGLVITGISLAAAFSTSTALATAASAAGPAGLAIALLTLAVTGPVNTGLWLDEYGAHLRASMSTGDQILTALALFFGVRNSHIDRAEVAKTGAGAAAARQAALHEDWNELMAFRADSLAKVGIGTVHHPDRKVVVRPATFRVEDQDPPYTFVLQDLPAHSVGNKTLHRDAIRDEWAPGVAWLGLDILGSQAPNDEQATADQWIELFGSDNGAIGGRGRDKFMLDSQSSGTVDGFGGVDDLVLDAHRADVTLRPMTHAGAPRWAYRLSVKQSGRTGERVTTMIDIERLTIRLGGSVDLQGGAEDDHFDVEATTAHIAGGGGRNTYVLRSGNTIATTSGDLAIWSPGVSAVIKYQPGLAADTVIQAGMLHEAISFSRIDDRLVLRHGQDTLTLIDFLKRPHEAPRDRQLLVVDALGTRMSLTQPREVGPEPRPSATMAKALFLDADTHATRRRLGGDHAATRYHLSGGGGAFHATPRTEVLLDVMLDVPVSRLRYRRMDDGLMIEEVAPGDAPSGYTPLTLMLPAPAPVDTEGARQRPMLWARHDTPQQGAIVLAHPAPGDPDAGPMRAETTQDLGRLSEGTPAPAAVAADGKADADPVDDTVVRGTEGPDQFDAALLPRATVLVGGEGPDAYRIPAGRSIVIDNTATDGERDLLDLEAEPGSLRLRREADDLLIETGDATIRLRGHASDPHARHLWLSVGPYGKRYAIPVVDASGIMLYGHDRADGIVPGFVPGRHLVPSPPGAAWSPRSSIKDDTLARTVSLGGDASFRKEGSSLVLSSGVGEASSKVFVDGYYRTFGHFEIDAPSWVTAPFKELPGGDGLRPLLKDGLRDTWRRYQGMGAPAALFTPLHDQGIDDEPQVKRLSQVQQAFMRPLASDAPACDPVAVRTYLRMMGLGAAIADKVQSTRPTHLHRMRRLLEVSSAAGLVLPATFLDAYAASDVRVDLSLQRHAGLLKHLAADSTPWPYAERVLSHDLPQEAVETFEAWARARPGAALDSPVSLDKLDEFARLLNARPDDTLIPTSATADLLALVLRLKGRPAEVATSLAAAMRTLGTLDEAWIDGMQRAGIVDHAVLARLLRAKVAVQDLMIGNARRQAYERGDRSSLIAVSVSSGLRQADSKAVRYVVKDHLALDGAGDAFTTRHQTPAPGKRYDLQPGVVVDASGQSPDGDEALSAWESKKNDLDREYRAKHQGPYWTAVHKKGEEGEKLRKFLETGRVNYVKRHLPPLSSVVHLYKDRLADMARYVQPGAPGFGRSSPDNLVDGAYAAGEATAWRPMEEFSGRTPQFLQFDFAHAVALDGVDLRYAPGPLDSMNADWSLGLWKLQALTDQTQWLDVSREDHVLKGTLRHFLRVDTGGVPYRSYRLSAVDPLDGCIAADSWLTEVNFTTVEAGLSPMITRLMAGGYSRQDSDVLMARGVTTDAAVARAVEVRQHLGALAPGLLADELLTQPPLSAATWRDLDRLKPFVAPAVLLREARQGWSEGSQAHLLADLWPRPASTPAIDRAAMAPVLHDALSSWRLDHGADVAGLPAGHDAALVQAVLDAATGDTRALARALHLPDWRGRTLGGQRTASRPVHLDAPRLNELLSPPSDGTAMPMASFDAPFLLAADAFIHLVKALHRRLVLDGGEQAAIHASTPALLQLLAVAARTSGLSLTLARPTAHFPSGESLRAAVDDVSRHLSHLGMTGVLKVGPIRDMDAPGSVDATKGPLHKALTLIEELDYHRWGLDRFSMDALARRRLDVKKRLMAAIFQDADLPAAPHLEDLADLILRSVACEPDALPLALKLSAGLLHRFSAKDSAEAGREAMLLVGKTMKTVIDGWRKGRDGRLKHYDARVSVAPEGMADILVAAALDVPCEFHLPQQTRNEIDEIVLVIRNRSARQIQAVRDAGLLKVTVVSETRPRYGILDWRQREQSRQWTTEAPLSAVFREPGLYMLSLGMTPDRVDEILDAGMRTPDEIDRFLQFQSTVMRDAPLAAAWAKRDPRPPLDHAATLWIPRLHNLAVAPAEILDIVSNGVSDTERALVLIDHLRYDTWGGRALVVADLAPLRDDIQRSVSPWMSPEASSSFSGLLVRAICGDRAALRDAVRLTPDVSVLIEAAQGLYEKVLTLSVDRLGEEQAAEAATPFALTLLTLSEVQRDETLYLPADGHDSPREIGEARVLARAAPQLQRLVDVGILRAQGIYETEPLGDDHVPFDLSGTTPTWRSFLPLTRVLTGPTTPGPVTQASLLSQAMATSGAAASPPAASQAMPRREVASAMLAPQAA